MRREFPFQGLKLPDPNPQMSVEDVGLSVSVLVTSVFIQVL